MGVIGAGISINGPSGIDTASLVEQLTALEQQKVTDVQNKVTTYKTQISAYGKLQSALSTVQTAAKALNTAASFDLFKSESSDSDIVTLTGGAGAFEGNYDIQVAQLAGSEKMISKDGIISSQSATLSSLLIGVGDISIDGTKITIDANDTIQDVRMKINSATDANGAKLNLSASVIQASTNNFRLVLTSKNTGAQGNSYLDVTGSTLKDLGIITGTVNGNASQVVTTQSPILNAFNALKTGSTIQYTGTNHSGSAVNGTYTKASATASINGFLTQLQSDFGGVTASVNGGGSLVITDGVIGASQLGLSSLVMTDSGAVAPISHTFTPPTVTGAAGVAQVIASQNPITSDFNALKAGATIDYSITSHGGVTVTNTYTKPTATTSIAGFIAQIQSDSGGAVASLDAGNNLVVTDSLTGVSNLAINSFLMTDSSPAPGPISNTFTQTVTGDISNAQVLTSQNPMLNDFDNLKAGATIDYSVTDHSGATVTNTFTKATATTSVTDFLAQIQSDSGGAVASLDGAGNLVLTDSLTGVSQLAVNSFAMNDTAAQPPAANVFASTVTGAVGVAQIISSQSPMATDFDNLKAGATIDYGVTDHSGATVTNTFTKTTATTSINDFLAQIQSDSGGAVASLDGAGNLVLTDSQTGVSQLAVNSFTMTDMAAQAPTTFSAAVTSSGNNGQGEKGTTTQSLTSTSNITAAFGALAVGSTITYAGMDHNGNTVSNSFYKTAGATINDFVTQVQQSFMGTADVSVNAGNLVITDKTAGSSRLALTTLSATDKDSQLTTAYTMDATVTGKNGAGVMSVGRDAFYSLDGLTMSSTDNSVESVIAGTTIQLHKASTGETVQATLSRDTDAIKAKVQKLVDAYNALQTFVTDQTKMADPNNKDSTAGDLAGDSTVKNILDRVRQQLMQRSGFAGESYNSLTMIGIKTDPTTGQMSIDDTQFSKAMTNGFDEVEHLFVTSGTGDNSNIILGRKTADTQSGTYTLRETDNTGTYSTNYLSIQLANDPTGTWYTSDLRNGDIVTFSSGPAKGLSLTSPAGIIGSGNTSSYTFSLGMGDGLSEYG
jgi:flagellar capping protein FliD